MVGAMEVEVSRWWLLWRVRMVVSRKVVVDNGEKVVGGLVLGGDGIGE